MEADLAHNDAEESKQSPADEDAHEYDHNEG